LEERPINPAESALDPHRIARMIGSLHNLRRYGGQWYEWAGNRFVLLNKEDVDNYIIGTLKHVIDVDGLVDRFGKAEQVTRALQANVELALRNYAFLPSERQMPFWTINLDDENVPMFALKNGLIVQSEAITGAAELMPHNPGYFNTILFPYRYEPTAECPQWEMFLYEVLEGDEELLALIQEIAGYLLTPRNDQQKFFMLEGEGANGKSVVLQVFEGLLGKANVSAVPLGVFAERFALMPTINKLLNICSEADETDKPPIGLLKQYIGGDTVTVDVKHREPITFTPTARLIITANSRPKFADTSDGMWRRLITIPFNVRIAEEKQDKKLAARIVDTELPGIFNWALRGLRRLNEQGIFTSSRKVVAAVAAYKLDMNAVHQFMLDSGYEAGTDSDFVCFSDLYKAYAQWCKDFGHWAKNDRNFSNEVAKLFPKSGKAQRTILGKRGVRVRTGIRRVAERKELHPAMA
jgi:putative DNA primase/helicase